jgi:hypothetical protein
MTTQGNGPSDERRPDKKSGGKFKLKRGFG